MFRRSMPAKKTGKSKPKARQSDLFAGERGRGGRENARTKAARAEYSAEHIEVLEGLEPVRRRPGMYVGGTDEKALHHLFAEGIGNSTDEGLARHAHFLEVEM